MSRQTLTIDGVSTADYDILITGSNTFETAEPVVKNIQIPGRSGDLIVDENRFKNFDLKYDLAFGSNFQSRFQNFAALLMSERGYRRLRDSFRPDVYRIGRIKKAVAVQKAYFRQGVGTMQVVFDCKPQLWLNSGVTAIEFEESGTVANPTQFYAKPLVRVYGAGQIGVNETYMEIEANSYPYIDIDCDTMNAYYGATNCNQLISLLNGTEFPTLKPGNNYVDLWEGITKLEITPRWWTI